MRVFALTFGGADYASSYYRVVQYQKPLQSHGIDLDFCPVKSFDWRRSLLDFDAVLLQKKLLPVSKVRWLHRNSKRLIYDTDDAIWHAQKGSHHWWTTWRMRRRLKAIANRSALCLAANSVLANFLERWNENVHVLPMALDDVTWRMRDSSGPHDKPIRIGWAGKGVNLGYLYAIEPALLKIQHAHPQVQFVIFSGDRPQFKHLECEFIAYKSGLEPDAIRGFDIGLLPLAAGPFAEGKSPIKALQYMASGIPAVVSPRGATRDMFQEGETALFAEEDAEWERALSVLIADRELRVRMGTAARRQFEANYALRSAAIQFASSLRSVTGTAA